MAGTLKRIAGPAYLANAAADIYTPPASTIYTNIKHIHIANVTAGAVTFTLYVGATAGSAGGTELEKAYSIAANSDWDKYFSPGLKMVSTDFLSGLASAGSSLVITVMGEQYVV
jgi:hypothetical protein